MAFVLGDKEVHTVYVLAWWPEGPRFTKPNFALPSCVVYSGNCFEMDIQGDEVAT